MAAQPAGWRGVKQAEGGAWAAVFAGDSPGGKPLVSALQLEGLASKAEAAAAWDLMQVWVRQQRGQEPGTCEYNLGYARYSALLPVVKALKTAEALQQHLRKMSGSGALAELVKDAPQEPEPAAVAAAQQPSARGADGDGGDEEPSKQASRKRRASDKEERQPSTAAGAAAAAAAATAEEGTDVLSSGRQPQKQGQGQQAGEGTPASAEGEEGRAASGGSKAKKPRTAAKPERQSDGGEMYAGITWARSWCAQVHFQKKQLTSKYAGALDAGRDRQTLNLGGFESDLEAAAAADLVMLYRFHVTGGTLAPKRYNYDLELYRGLESSLYACKTIRDCKEFVKGLRDTGALAALIKGQVPQASPAAAAAPAPGKQQQRAGGGGTAEKANGRAGKQAQQAAERPGAGPSRKVAVGGPKGKPEEVQADPRHGTKVLAAAATTQQAAAAEATAAGAAAGEGAEEEAGSRQRPSRLTSPVGSPRAGAASPHPQPTSPRGGGPASPRGGGPASPRVAARTAAGAAAAAPRAATSVSPRVVLRVPLSPGSKGKEKAAGPAQQTPKAGWGLILDLGNTWACQVGLTVGRCTADHKAALPGSTGRYVIRVSGFTKAEAAAAADFGLMYRTHVYGEEVPEAPYNFPYELYASKHPGIIKKILACKTAEDAKGVIMELRGGSILSQLAAAGRGTAKTPGPAAVAAAAAAASPRKRSGGGSDAGTGSGRPSSAGATRQQQQQQQQQQGAGGGASTLTAGASSGAKEAAGVLAAAKEGRGGGAPSVAQRPRARGPEPEQGKPRGPEVVGQGVRIYWPLDDEWYPGVITAYDAASGRHHVQYDDGEEQDVVMWREAYRLTKRRRSFMQQLQAAPTAAKKEGGEGAALDSPGPQRRAGLGAPAGGSRPTSPDGSPAKRKQAQLAQQGRQRGAQQRKRKQRETESEADSSSSEEEEESSEEERLAPKAVASPRRPRLGETAGSPAQRKSLGEPQPRRQGAAAAGAGGVQQRDPAEAAAAAAAEGRRRQAREEMERMYEEVKAVLARTPGIEDEVAQGFLSRYLNLRDTWRLQHREIKAAHDAGRPDLVCQWVWVALEPV